MRNAQLHEKQSRSDRTAIASRASAAFVLATLALLFAGVAGGGFVLGAKTQETAKATSEAVQQATYSTPEEAMRALVEAVNAGDHAALKTIFGPESDQLSSGDPVEDKHDLEDFATAIHESAQVKKADEGKYTLVVGNTNWPTPIPIVKRENQWLFDTKAGLEEILNRRIGENELSAIVTCRAYVMAQWEHFTGGEWDHDGVAAYAQRFISSPGRRDGLYWETAEGEAPSPLGKLVAEARAEGYGPRAKSAKDDGAQRQRRPYHGYYFKILTQQGANAPGGKYSYIINGNMIAGYALVAYPAKWGNSGVITFIVNQQGRVYEKNLGADTVKTASAMTEYNPDTSWKLVEP